MGQTATDWTGNLREKKKRCYKYRRKSLETAGGMGNNWNWSLEEDITHDMNKCATLHCLKRHTKGT
jgi:hypothetical protein